MKITVEKRHLDKAIKAIVDKAYYDDNISVCCPIAQAAKEQLGEQFISMGLSVMTLKEKQLVCEEAYKITDLSLADIIVESRKEIEAMLPMTLEFVENS